ncbi:TPA: AAA family ATPase [Legionella pneumophila]|uniref:AAA family ATPase n=1 Tax=Legionella pneumophila TaxID=446 RepID=A0AAN5KTK6_LEGPN|nr:AAA family ATPase [Legionella pneumophila]MCK1859321.1 AAA family ATPase [Legionella pneumophila]HAT1597663.1 AAA family ATPase [Legionella pneumophila]HAT1758534.1 AAA family ATPase [Legionella pneumophila]HAT1761274.1 AAA family ATPase [Legionella pneumophila]HAT1764526.1 AAA family ATPase [Legionella pneumophila]
MYTEIMEFFNLKQPLTSAGYYETEQRKKLYKELKFLIQSGGIYALTGMVGAGKTTLLNRIQHELELENKIIVSRSLSTEKNRLNVSTVYLALFYDLTRSDKNFKVPTQGEKRERQLIDLIKKQKKPIALFIDEAHDIHGHTLTALKRIVEIVAYSGCQLSIVLAGHPKLGNSLSTSSIEEIGARTKIFSIDDAMGNMEKYIDWLFKQSLHEKIKVNEVIAPEAALRLAQALITPLQIHKYLSTAMEIAYSAAVKPITEEVINKALAPDLNSMEAQLARIGYQLPSICELLHATPKEVKDFLYGKATSPRKNEFLSAIRSIGVVV